MNMNGLELHLSSLMNLQNDPEANKLAAGFRIAGGDRTRGDGR